VYEKIQSAPEKKANILLALRTHRSSVSSSSSVMY